MNSPCSLGIRIWSVTKPQFQYVWMNNFSTTPLPPSTSILDLPHPQSLSAACTFSLKMCLVRFQWHANKNRSIYHKMVLIICTYTSVLLDLWLTDTCEEKKTYSTELLGLQPTIRASEQKKCASNRGMCVLLGAVHSSEFAVLCSIEAGPVKPERIIYHLNVLSIHSWFVRPSTYCARCVCNFFACVRWLFINRRGKHFIMHNVNVKKVETLITNMRPEWQCWPKRRRAEGARKKSVVVPWIWNLYANLRGLASLLARNLCTFIRRVSVCHSCRVHFSLPLYAIDALSISRLTRSGEPHTKIHAHVR